MRRSCIILVVALTITFLTITILVLIRNTEAPQVATVTNATHFNLGDSNSTGRFLGRNMVSKDAMNNARRDIALREYIKKTKLDPRWDWKQPISFWGIVVDDSGMAIGGARVRFSWSNLSPLGTDSVEVESDKAGRFELLGRHGKGINVSISKDGYRQCGWGTVGFEYADPSDALFHEPDPLKPVRFELIRRGGREFQVRRVGMEFRIDEGSNQLAIDLLSQQPTETITTNVDLLISVAHGPIVERDGHRQFDWKVRISAPSGGIQLGSKCPPFAPLDGYIDSIEYKESSDGPNSRTGVQHETFFLICRSKSHYARVSLSVFPAPLDGGLPIVRLHEYVLNPSGSRNLEFYPEMQVEAKYYVPRER